MLLKNFRSMASNGIGNLEITSSDSEKLLGRIELFVRDDVEMVERRQFNENGS